MYYHSVADCIGTIKCSGIGSLLIRSPPRILYPMLAPNYLPMSNFFNTIDLNPEPTILTSMATYHMLISPFKYSILITS